MELLLANNNLTPPASDEDRGLRWLDGGAGKMTIVFMALVVFHILYVTFHWGGDTYAALISNVFAIVVYLATSLYARRTSRNESLTPRSRMAWRFIALANGSYLSGAILWTYFENYLGEQPFPSIADVGYLLFFPLMMPALLLLVEPMKSAEERIGFGLDVTMIMIGGGLAMWYFLLQPLISAADGYTWFTVLSIAYPVGDLILLFGVVTIILRRGAYAGSGAITLVLVGVIMNFAADWIFGYQNLHGIYKTGDPVDALWTIGCLPIILGAHYLDLLARRGGVSPVASGVRPSTAVVLPYLAVALAFAILILIEFDETSPAHQLNAFISIILTALAMLRQFMFLRENTRSKAKLTELREHIEGIYSASADGIAVADFDGNLLEVNDAFSKLMGYEREELTSGFKALDLTSALDRETTLEVNKRVIAEQVPVDYEKEYVRKDGTVFTAHVTAFPVRSRQGAPAAIAAIVRDITGQKSSENKLREAEQRWQLALRVNRDGVWDWDLKSKKFYFSPRWREMFGYSPDENLHFTMAVYPELFHPDDRYLANPTRVALMNPESPYIDVEFRHKCKDGSYRWIRRRGESVIDKETGRLERVIGLDTDISEKKQRELESEALGNILRGVSETANRDELLSFIHGAIGNVVHARNFFVALHDTDTDLFIMQFFVDQHDEKPASANLKGTRADYVFRTGRPLLLDAQKTAALEAQGEFRLIGTQPEYWLGVPLRTPDKIIGVLVVQSYDKEHSYSDDNLNFLNNVAGPIALSIERKRAESRTLLLNAALDAAANGILITDGNGSIEWSNRAFTTLTGYGADEVKGKNSQILRSGKHDDEFYADMWQTISAGKPWKGELTNRRKSGELYEEEMTITPVFDEASGTNHFISIKSDITERKLAEEQLRVFNHKLQLSNRELQDFAFVASHDLQEPLRKVQTFADRLSTKYSGALDETGLDYLERMRNAAGRMQTLIHDLLSFSRVTTKAQPFMPVDVEEITKGVLSDLEVKIEETGASVEMIGLPVIDADPSQMRQLVQNLVGNALKFRRDGVAPVVKISAEPRENGNGGAFEITVEDNGIGFDEKYLDKIFTVFQRLHGRAEYEGSGIGLAVCRKIVERHNGTITAISTPGNGAKFKFTLPTHQSNAEIT